MINGERQYLWRAVDHDSDLIDILVQPRRAARAARRFFRRLLHSPRQDPVRLVTDTLGSYRVAPRDVMPLVTHATTRDANTRADVSHQPTRQRERQMRGFPSSAHAQCFLPVHGIMQHLFRVGRHRLRSVHHRMLRARALLRLAGRVVGRVRNVWSNPPADEGVARNAIDRGDLVRFGVHFCQEPPAITRAWTLTSRILVHLRDAVTARGASIAVLTVPAIEEVDPDAQRIALSTASDASKVCLGEAPGYRRLTELLAQLDIPVVDLLPTFRTAMSEGQAGLFRREKHWGPTGHALAAEHVLTAITEGNWLAPDATRPEGR